MSHGAANGRARSDESAATSWAATAVPVGLLRQIGHVLLLAGCWKIAANFLASGTATNGVEGPLAELMDVEQRGRVALTSSEWQRADRYFRAVLDMWHRQRPSQPHALLAGCAASAYARLGYLAHERQQWEACVDHFGHTDGLGSAAGMRSLQLYERHILTAGGDAALLARRDADWAASNKTMRRLVDQYATCLLRLSAQELRHGRTGPTTEEAVALSAEQHARGSARRVIFEAATSAGIFRHAWQGAVTLSPRWHPSWDARRTQPYWSAEQAGCAALVDALESSAAALRDEARRLLVQQRVPGGARITVRRACPLTQLQTGTWGELFVYRSGELSDENDVCPHLLPSLCALLLPFAGTLSRDSSSAVKLNLQFGGTVSYPHSGPVDTKLRIFLVLALPAHRRGQITVAGETRPWREGEAIIFDDSLEHWVAFDAEPTAQRIVLVVDVPHPDLRETTNR